ncbi:hypothetical protein VAE055_370340 [Vibrio aestuarianus]|nr:hypothetical protein VAE055_370340 [Vibrio aestuarianus]CAH8205807.1 hypothetical protein VAE016_370341 [Vibrio aestuarianus]
MHSHSTVAQVYEVDEDIVLRTAQPGDADMIASYFNANRAHLRPWEPKREAAFFDVNGWRQKLIKLHELHKMQLGYYLLIIDKVNNEMLGTISFSNMSRFPFHACNLGYSLAEHAQGKGLWGVHCVWHVTICLTYRICIASWLGICHLINAVKRF